MSGDQHHAFAKGQFVVWKVGLTRAHRYRRDIWLPHGPAVGGFLRGVALRPLRDSLEDIPHGRRFPFAAPRRGNASPVESGGDLSERRRTGSLNLSNGRQDDVCMHFGPRYAAGVDGGAGVG